MKLEISILYYKIYTCFILYPLRQMHNHMFAYKVRHIVGLWLFSSKRLLQALNALLKGFP